jgi:hypothetical protein
MGLNEKRAEAVKDGQERIWEAYGEVSSGDRFVSTSYTRLNESDHATQFARNLACLSHAASILTPMLPTPTTSSHLAPTQSINTYDTLTAGEQMERTRGVEEGVRRTLGGLEGGWQAKIDDGWVIAANFASERHAN